MIRRLFSILGEDSRPLGIVMLGLILGAVLQGIGFAMIIPIIESLADLDTGQATRWLGAELAVLALYSVVHYRTQLAAYQTAISLGEQLYTRLGDHITQLPLGWFDDEQVGHVGRLASTGIVDVMGMPAHQLRPFVTALVTPVTVAVATLAYDLRLGLVMVATVPFLALVHWGSAGIVERMEHRTDAAAVSASNRLVEFAKAQPVVRAYGAGADRFRSLDDVLVALRSADRRMLIHAAVGVFGFAFVVQACLTAVLFVGSDQIIDAVSSGVGSPAKTVALLVLATRAAEPLRNAGEMASTLRMTRNSLGRIDALLREEVLPETESAAEIGEPAVEFEDVDFAYDSGGVVLEGLSFKVSPRTMTAFVGPSGSGKTTIARLVSRFWDVDSGVVSVAGSDVRDLSTADLMAQVSIVFQDVYLFDGTIESNILVAKPQATPDEVASVVRLARVDEIVERLPDGMQSRVGEGGVALSGGERQRVSIARALLKDAPIVILDEPTAAIDPENEVLLQGAIAALTAERTVLVIAHRLDTIVNADQIVVLDEGRVVESGTHEELAARGGRYTDFWLSRERASGWRLG